MPMHSKFVGVFNDDLTADLWMSLSVKEFLKSVSIWRSYRQKYSILFFLLTHNIYEEDQALYGWPRFRHDHWLMNQCLCMWYGWYLNYCTMWIMQDDLIHSRLCVDTDSVYPLSRHPLYLLLAKLLLISGKEFLSDLQVWIFVALDFLCVVKPMCLWWMSLL